MAACLEPDSDVDSPTEIDSFDAQKVSHLTKMAQKLNRLRANDSFCDVTIRLSNVEYRAHKVVLVSASDYFDTMFTAGYSETTKAEVTLEETPDLNPERFAVLLDFMYTGELKLTLDSVPEILATASYLQVIHAIQACADYLNRALEENTLTFELCLKVSSMTSCHEIDDVVATANQYLATTFSENCQKGSFLKLVTRQTMSDLVDRNDLQVSDESKALDALVAWLKYDWKNRKTHAIDLLGRIRLGLVPLDKIVEAFENQLAVFEKESTDCRTLYMDIMKYHSFGKKSFVSTVLGEETQGRLFSPRGDTQKTLLAIGSKASFCFIEEDGGLRKIKLPFGTGESQTSYGHTIAVGDGGRLYCVGGHAQNGNTGSYDCTSCFIEFNQKECTWISLTGVNAKRSNIGVMYFRGYLYLVGGTNINNNNTAVEIAERYSIATEKCQKLPKLPLPWSSGRINMAHIPSVAAYEHYLLFANNYCLTDLSGNTSRKIQLHMFNTQNNTWHNLHSQNNNQNDDFHLYICNEIIYLILFRKVPSKHDASSKWQTCPTVQKCQCRVGDGKSKPGFTVGETVSQKGIPETTMRAFRIGKDVYIIVRGYVYKTRVTIDDNQVYDIDLSSYSSLESVDKTSFAVTSYNVDRRYISI